MKRFKKTLVIISLTLGVGLITVPFTQSIPFPNKMDDGTYLKTKEKERFASFHVNQTYEKLPLNFFQNDGQMGEEEIKYYSLGSGYTAYFSKQGVFFKLYRSPGGVSVQKQTAREGLHSKEKTLNPLHNPLDTQVVKFFPVGANKNLTIIPKG